jgi:hypothetical protein
MTGQERGFRDEASFFMGVFHKSCSSVLAKMTKVEELMKSG